MSGLPLGDHFTVLIYPFQHALRADDAARWARTLSSRWSPWWARLRDDWPGNAPPASDWLRDLSLRRALDDAYFFLPFARRALFPETEALDRACPVSGEFYDAWREQLLAWIEDLPRFIAAVPFSGALRLTCHASEVRGAGFTVQPRRRQGGQEVAAGAARRARLAWADAILFPSGVGFLLLKVTLAEAESDFAGLLELNAALPALYPATIEGAVAALGFPGAAKSITLRDLVDLLLQGMGPRAPAAAPGATDAWIVPADGRALPELGAYLRGERWPSGYRHSEGEAGQYGDQLNGLTFAAPVTTAAMDALPAGPFPNAADRLLYELATGLRWGEAVTRQDRVPATEALEPWLAAHYLHYWRAWRGSAFRDSVAFLQTEVDLAGQGALSGEIERSYLPLYLYTLYQNHQLLAFANELTARTEMVAPAGDRATAGDGTRLPARLREWWRQRDTLRRSLREARQLATRFVAFRNRYWFNEVTRRAPGHELYRKFQQALEVPELYELVSAEVTAIREYYESKQDRRTAALINWFTFVFTPLSAVMGLFSMTFSEGSWVQFWAWSAIVLAASGLVWRFWARE